jgi:hypothetical protein
MSNTTARGVGNAYLATTTLGGGTGSEQYIFPTPLFNFEETVDSSPIEAQAQIDGVLQTVEAGTSTITRTLTLTTQIFNTNMRPLVFGQLPKAATSFTIEVLKTVTLDNTEVIADPLITAANLQSIRVFKNGVGRLTPTASAATAPASAAQVQIDTTANELVFFAGEEGETISYTVPRAVTSAKKYGGTGTKTPLGRMAFRCAVFGLDGSLVEYRHYPALDLVTPPSQSFSGEIPELTLEFLAATPAGWSDPYEIIDASTIVFA